MSNKNRNQHNQNQQNHSIAEEHYGVDVQVEEIPQAGEQVAAPSTSTTSTAKEEGFFSLKRDSGGYAGSYVAAGAALIGSGVSSLLSDNPLGVTDAGAAVVSAAAGFGAGKLVDAIIENDYARYAGAGAVGGGIGFTVGSFSQRFKGSYNGEPASVEVPVIEAGAI